MTDMNSYRMVRAHFLLVSSLWRQRRLGLVVGQYALVSFLLAIVSSMLM